jgi:hypothetical protein
VFSSIGIVWGLCSRNAAGRSVRAFLGDLETFMHPHMVCEAFRGKTKAVGKYPACRAAVKRGVLERQKHEVGCATGSHVIMN